MLVLTNIAPIEEEKWLPVTGRFPELRAAGEAGWEVSNWGRIRRGHEYLSSKKTKYGHPQVEFPGGFKTLLSQVVASAWCPNPTGSVFVKHHDRKYTSNHCSNLYWSPRKDASPTDQSELTLEGEEWRSVQGAPDYEVSNLGRVRKDGRIFKPLHGWRGERFLTLYHAGGRTTVQLKRLVANAFIPNPMGHERVQRRQGVPSSSNKAADLSWGSPGRSPAPRRTYSRLTPDQVLEIRSRYAAGETQTAIHADLKGRGVKVTLATVSNAAAGRTFKPKPDRRFIRKGRRRV